MSVEALRPRYEDIHAHVRGSALNNRRYRPMSGQEHGGAMRVCVSGTRRDNEGAFYRGLEIVDDPRISSC